MKRAAPLDPAAGPSKHAKVDAGAGNDAGAGAGAGAGDGAGAGAGAGATTDTQSGNPLDAATARVHVPDSAFMSATDCATIVREAEAHAAGHGGWTTKRHVAYPTKDIAAKDVAALHWLPGRIQQDLLPGFELHYGLRRGSLFIEDLFVAKYEFDASSGDGQPGLVEHEDGSPWSFVVPLNAAANFDGGGTRFVHPIPGGQQLFRPPLGTAVMFSGKNRHCGVSITRGVRYILAGFCGDDSEFTLEDHGASGDEDDDDDEEYDEEDSDGESDGSDDDGAAEAAQLAAEADMDLASLLPPGYLAAREAEK